MSGSLTRCHSSVSALSVSLLNPKLGPYETGVSDLRSENDGGDTILQYRFSGGNDFYEHFLDKTTYLVSGISLY